MHISVKGPKCLLKTLQSPGPAKTSNQSHDSLNARFHVELACQLLCLRNPLPSGLKMCKLISGMLENT